MKKLYTSSDSTPLSTWSKCETYNHKEIGGVVFSVKADVS